MRIVGMLAKAGNSAFGERLASGDYGSSVHVTHSDFKAMQAELIEKNPAAALKYVNLKSMYDFEDDIPKTGLIIKYREGLDRETAEMIKFGLLTYVQDFTIWVSEKYALEDFFTELMAPFIGYSYFLSLMMLLLTFFMTAVSYS